MALIEAKTGTRPKGRWFDRLDRVAAALPRVIGRAVVHGGSERCPMRGVELLPVSDLSDFLGGLDQRAA